MASRRNRSWTAVGSHPIWEGIVVSTIDAASLSWAQSFTGVKLSVPPPGSPGSPPPPTDPAVESVKTEITSKFSVKKVGAQFGASWKADELQPVAAAFSAVPPVDQDYLRDIEVERVPRLGNDPNSAAVYSTMTDPTTVPPKQTRKIMVADATFVDVSSGSAQIVSAEERKRKIVHEVGHVVVKKGRLDADRAEAQAVAAYRNAEASRQRVAAAIKTATGPELAQLQQQLTGLEGAVKQAMRMIDDAKKAVAKHKVPQSVVDAGQAQADAAENTAAGVTRGAKATTMSAQEARDSAAYRQASDAVNAAIKTHADAMKAGKIGIDTSQKSPGKVDEELEPIVRARNAARQSLARKSRANPALKVYEPVDRTQDDWLQKLQTQARLPERSPEVQEFVELMTREHIDPAIFTPYSAFSWPAQPEEVLADAYSFWVMKPAFMHSRAPSLARWFDGGNYRS
jgi:hypothetical protein